MEARALVQYYSASQGPKVVSGEGDTAQVLAQVTVSTVTREGRNSQTLSTKPVALLLSFRHAEGFGDKIERVTEVEPQTVSKGADGTGGATVASAKPKGDDLFNQVGGVVKVVSNAASTVTNTVSTVDQAKNILGF